jgi:hypothetical protein
MSMGWILQGNPKRFDVDSYVGSYPYVYWSCPTNQRDINLNDRAFIWRAGLKAGAVAIGEIAELPKRRDAVNYPEALGDDLWAKDLVQPS